MSEIPDLSSSGCIPILLWSSKGDPSPDCLLMRGLWGLGWPDRSAQAVPVASYAAAGKPRTQGHL
eukprot:8940261-Pyramimonas_sp.AAC.1